MAHNEDEVETVEIVSATGRNPDDPTALEAQTKEVPKRWYEELQHADDVFQGVKEEWIQRDGVTSVGLSPGAYDGDDATEIVVTVDRGSENVETGIPESVDGVAVRIEYSDPRDDQLL